MPPSLNAAAPPPMASTTTVAAFAAAALSVILLGVIVWALLRSYSGGDSSAAALPRVDPYKPSRQCDYALDRVRQLERQLESCSAAAAKERLSAAEIRHVPAAPTFIVERQVLPPPYGAASYEPIVVGYLTAEGTSGPTSIGQQYERQAYRMPLHRQASRTRRERYHYFTFDRTGIRLPIVVMGRDCTDDIACSELYSNDIVQVGLESMRASYRVWIYDT